MKRRNQHLVTYEALAKTHQQAIDRLGIAHDDTEKMYALCVFTQDVIKEFLELHKKRTEEFFNEFKDSDLFEWEGGEKNE